MEKPVRARTKRLLGLVLGAACWVAAGAALAQTGAPPAPAPAVPGLILPAVSLPEPPKAEAPAAPSPDGGVVQASCQSCGGGLLGGPPGCIGGCGGGQCVPGRLNCCSPCLADTCCGRVLCCLYNCVCCPDPCYEPHWIGAANAAFFVDSARPVTQMRLRWDNNIGIPRPDRSEYWMARESVNQLIPTGPCTRTGSARGVNYIASTVDIQEFRLYNEVAAGPFSFFVEMAYRELDPAGSALSPNPACHESGFSDMNLGTKSLLLDCDLLQATFQFTTFIPIGNVGKGLGTGHVSLEPALLFTLKLTPDTYLQAETAYWFSVGGDDLYQGSIAHNHLSLNQVLWRFLPDVQLIGTLEASEYSWIAGNFTEAHFVSMVSNRPFAVSSSACAFSAGPGVRLNICDRIDFGVGTQFGLGSNRWADTQVRSEFRWRF
jgi:hypothetical protein